MSSVPTDPATVRREAVKQKIVEAIRDSEFPDTGSREVAEALEISHGRARKLVQELREEGQIEVTRRVGPAKLYRVPDEDADE